MSINNRYPNLQNIIQNQEEVKRQDEYENYDDIDEDEEYESIQMIHNNENSNNRQNQQQNNKLDQQNIFLNKNQPLPTFDKSALLNMFKNDSELEGIQVEIMDQTSKTDWYIVEHVMYTIKSYQNIKEQNSFIVQRRYSDFEWLFKEFEMRYVGIILPPLPEKSALSKINLQKVDLISRTDFFEDRLVGLKAFLKKVLDHPNLSKTKEFKSFIRDNENEFSKFKDKSLVVRQSGENGSGMIKKFYNSFSQGITTAVDYISGTRQKRERERTKDDDKFDKFEKYYIDQKEKISETTNCLHHIFDFKKKQSENMEQISIILEQLQINFNLNYFFILLKENQKGVSDLQETTQKASEYQKKISKDLIKSIEVPLKEQVKHFDSCLNILNHRKELLDRIFENQQKIEQISRIAGKQDEISHLSDEIERDELRIETLQYLFLEDSEYFNKMIQQQIKQTISNFSSKSIEHSQMMARIWQNQN